MTDLAGFHAALPTPFTADGRIAERVLGDLVRHNIRAGMHGLYVGGSTGEAFLMSKEERARSFAVAAEAAAGDCVLIAHVGDLNPAVSRDLAREAARLGYDSISAVPPFYYGYAFAELKAHYALLASATDLPFLIYNFPALTGVTMSAQQIAELLELPNVAGVKNTSADYYALEQMRRLAPKKVLLNGFDESLLAGLSMGADGGIGSTYNLHPEKVLRVAEHFRAGDMAAAAATQADINGLVDVLVTHGVLRSIKYLLELQGFAAGACRAPFAPLTAEAREALERAANTFLATSPKAPAEVEG